MSILCLMLSPRTDPLDKLLVCGYCYRMVWWGKGTGGVEGRARLSALIWRMQQPSKKKENLKKMKQHFSKKKNFTSAWSILTHFCFVQCVQVSFVENGSTARRRRKAPTHKRIKRVKQHSQGREAANNTQKEEQHMKGNQRQTAPTPRTGEAGKKTPLQRRTTSLSLTSLLFTLI